jgi:hypothetical protein
VFGYRIPAVGHKLVESSFDWILKIGEVWRLQDERLANNYFVDNFLIGHLSVRLLPELEQLPKKDSE